MTIGVDMRTARARAPNNWEHPIISSVIDTFYSEDVNDDALEQQLHGRRLRGTGGTVPLIIWGGGTAHAPISPNILRSTVIGCEAKYKLTKKVSRRNFCVLKSNKERVRYVIYQISDSRDREKTDKIESMTRKEVVRNFGPWKWKLFPKKIRKCVRPPKFGAKSPPIGNSPDCIVRLGLRKHLLWKATTLKLWVAADRRWKR